MLPGSTKFRAEGFAWFDYAILLAGVALVLVAGVMVPFFVPARVTTAHSSCIANLKQIEAAKATWALELKKLPADIPTDSDLFGMTNYIREKAICPQGGTYTLGKVGEKPKCSVMAHTL